MRATINRPLFSQTRWDSAALTQLASIIQPLAEPGEYRGEAFAAGRRKAMFEMIVDPSSTVHQVDVDLAAVVKRRQAGCDCKPGAGPRPPRFVVAPGGVAVFYTSRGSLGLGVRLDRMEKGQPQPVLQAERMGQPTLFAAALIRPGTYEVLDHATGARGRITVSYVRPGPTRYRAPAPTAVEVRAAGFEPADIRVAPGQAVVFRSDAPSRLVIELEQSDDGLEAEQGTPKRQRRTPSRARQGRHTPHR